MSCFGVSGITRNGLLHDGVKITCVNPPSVPSVMITAVVLTVTVTREKRDESHETKNCFNVIFMVPSSRDADRHSETREEICC